MGEPILNLSTVVKRETIKLTSKRHPNGRIYEVRNLSDLGPYEHAQLRGWQAEISEIGAKARPTKAQEKRASELLDETVRLIVLDLEPSVFAELTPQQKESIVFAWAAAMSRGAEGNRRSRRTTGG